MPNHECLLLDNGRSLRWTGPTEELEELLRPSLEGHYEGTGETTLTDGTSLPAYTWVAH